MPIQSTHPDYKQWIGRWTKCRDAVEGSEAIKGATTAYLPKLSGHYDPKHGDAAYAAYLNRALWFGATDRTLNGYVGAIMRRDPSFKVPEIIKSRLDDVTDSGQNHIEFIHSQLKELLTTGRYGLLVDKHSEDAGEGEPAFIKIYYPENIRNWIVDDNGELLAVVLQECVYRPRGGDVYDQEEVKQLRELVMLDGVYAQRIWQERKSEDISTEEYDLIEIIYPTMRGALLDEIPFIFVSCDKDAMSCSKPPMLDLVNTNIHHYQLSADYRHGLHFTALPTPVFTGVTDEKDYFLGSEVAINLRAENAQAFFLEFQGTGLSAIKDALEEYKIMMAAQGASLIQRGKQGKGVETAEAARIQQSGETSLLSTIVGRVEEGSEKAFMLVARWEGVSDEESVDVVLNRDFIDSTMTAAEITALVLAWQSGGLPVGELYWNFQRGGVINPATTKEDFEKDVTAAQAAALARAQATAPASDGPAGASNGPGPGGGGPGTPGGGKTPGNTE